MIIDYLKGFFIRWAILIFVTAMIMWAGVCFVEWKLHTPYIFNLHNLDVGQRAFTLALWCFLLFCAIPPLDGDTVTVGVSDE